MSHMFEIYFLIAITVSGIAGFAGLFWVSRAAARDYARARRAMDRIAREPVANSRTISRNRAA